VIEATCVGTIKPVDAEVEVEDSFPGDPGLFDGFIMKFGLLFLESKQH